MATTYPHVVIAILAKQKAPVLWLYLQCIEALDYPKSRITLWIRTNDSTDDTETILYEWICRVGGRYKWIHWNKDSINPAIAKLGVHEWGPSRVEILGRLRKESLEYAIDKKADFYFVVDCDNYIKPHTLKALIALNLPIVAPLLRHTNPESFYSNFWITGDAHGYFQDVPSFWSVVRQEIKGIIQADCVHCTYLVKLRNAACEQLQYTDIPGPDGMRYEFIIFCESARRLGIQQYIDNREVYGYLNMDEEADTAARLLGVTRKEPAL